MRRIAVWVVLLLAMAGGVGRWVWLDLWERRNQMLADGIRERIQHFAPGWRIEFDSAEWLPTAQVRLHNVRAGAFHRDEPYASAPDVLLDLDPELLTNGFQVFITRVAIEQPSIAIVRDSAGGWNFAGAPSLPHGDLPLPAVDIHNGTVHLRMEASEFWPLTEFQLTAIDAACAGEAFRSYRITGRSAADNAGSVEFDGALDVNTWAWSVAGKCPQLQSPDGLLNVASGISNEARERLRTLAEHAAVTPSSSNASGDQGVYRAASHSQGQPTEVPGCAIPALGVAAQVELAFRLNQSGPGQPLLYDVGVRLQDGVIDNPALPAPLRNLSGEIAVDNSQVVFRALQASSGESRLFLDGRMSRDPAAPARRFTIQARNLEFGREIHRHLWGGLLRTYESLRPAGRFNVDLNAETDGAGDWNVHLNRFEAFGCSVLPEHFPYPAHHISGVIRQDGDRFLVDFQGLAGDRPLTVRGEFEQPGPGLRAAIDVHVDKFALDETFRQALNVEELHGFAKTIESLRLTGLADVDARLTKLGIPGDRWKVGLDARLQNAALNLVSFPYAVDDLSVQVLHDPLAADPARRDIWQFLGLQGRHGPGRISGAGAYLSQSGRKLLDLQLTALGAPIDRDLELACVEASPRLRAAFDCIAREGTVDLETIRVLWSPQTRPVISLPSIVVKDGAFRLTHWPYAWERATGTFAWNAGRLVISQLTAWHGGDTYLQVDNHGETDAAVLEVPEQGDVDWHLHLEDVQMRRIVPDATFRQSLGSAGLAAIVEKLDPRGPLDLTLGVDLKGAKNDPAAVTAAWTLDVNLLGNSLTPGIELRDMNGRLRIERGVWDGTTNFIDGHFRLDSVNVFDLPLTAVEGPFLVDGTDLYVGLPTWPEAGRPPAYDPDLNPRAGQQARGEIYKGKLGFDAHVRLNPDDPEKTVYRAAVTVRDALLEEWARNRGVSADRLKGPVNSRIDVLGQGSSDRNVRGSGWVQISPAQLYELPVLNRMLASLELRQPDKTAFRYADGTFTLHDGLVDFREIQLLGESLLLVGRGSVAFGAGLNQQLAIEFLRSKFRNRIPLIGQAISAVTSNSIGVRVGGTLSAPVVDVQTKLGLVDDTLRKVIEGFEAGQMPGPPRAMPNVGQPQRPNRSF